MKTILAIIIALALAGCATQAEKIALADSHYKAQESFAAAQKPIFELEGIEGESIRLSGVKALRVFAGQPAQFQAAPQPADPFVETLKLAKELTLGLAPFALGAKVITGMTKMSADGHGPVTTTTTSTTAPITTTTSNANQANPTTTTNTAGSNSVIGSGTASNPTTTTNTTTNTTTTDSHPVTTSTNTCTTGTC